MFKCDISVINLLTLAEIHTNTDGPFRPTHHGYFTYHEIFIPYLMGCKYLRCRSKDSYIYIYATYTHKLIISCKPTSYGMAP